MRIIDQLEKYKEDEKNEEEEEAAASMKTAPQQSSLMPYDDLISNRPGSNPEDIYLRRVDKDKKERSNLNIDPDLMSQKAVGNDLPGISMKEEREKAFGASKKHFSLMSRRKKKTEEEKKKKRKKRRRLRTRQSYSCPRES